MRLLLCGLGLACLLPACAGGDPIELSFRGLPIETTTLDMSRSRPRSARHYALNVRSHVDRSVRLKVRFDGPAPEGMSVRMTRGHEFLPRGSGRATLTFQMPAATGPVRGKIVIEADALPGWSRTYAFEGMVEARPYEGPRLRARPSGVPLGDLRPGERKPFAVALENDGSAETTVHETTVEDAARVRLDRADAPTIIRPGGALQLVGVVTAPKAAGGFSTRVHVRSNAVNVKNRLDIVLSGRVVPDYAPRPLRLLARAAYPVLETEYPVAIQGREGTEPFVIGRILGHEAVLAVRSRGSKEPAHEQQVVFRLRRDAPTDPASYRDFKVRFRLEPVGVEVILSVALRLFPPIHALPPEVHFGRVLRGYPQKKEIRLAAISGRKFQVESAHAQKGLFELELKHAPGLEWRVLVGLPNRSGLGLLQDKIVIETNDPDVPKIIVPVKADVR
ncbi:MAG: COG1470 family protein [Planctomycetota bacterium]